MLRHHFERGYKTSFILTRKNEIVSPPPIFALDALSFFIIITTIIIKLSRRRAIKEQLLPRARALSGCKVSYMQHFSGSVLVSKRGVEYWLIRSGKLFLVTRLSESPYLRLETASLKHVSFIQTIDNVRRQVYHDVTVTLSENLRPKKTAGSFFGC